MNKHISLLQLFHFEVILLNIMQRIRDDDPRLRGHPSANAIAKNKKGYYIYITDQGDDGITRQCYSASIYAIDYGGDMEAAYEAARELLYQENDKRGLVYNKCIVLANGDIEMDLGHGYKMTFSPGRIDVIIPYRWFASASSTSKHLIYAKTYINGKQKLCHRLLTNAPRSLVVDHSDG